MCLSKKKYPKFILLAVVELRESERDKTQKLNNPCEGHHSSSETATPSLTASRLLLPPPSPHTCCYRPSLHLTRSRHACCWSWTDRIDIVVRLKTFRSGIFFSLFLSYFILIYLTTCCFVSSLVTLTESSLLI